MHKYKIPSQLSEKQIEADAASYFGRLRLRLLGSDLNF